MDHYKTPTSTLDNVGIEVSEPREFGPDFWSLFWRYMVVAGVCMVLSNLVLREVIDLNTAQYVMYKPSILGLCVALLLGLATALNVKGLASFILPNKVGFSDSVWIRFNGALIVVVIVMALSNILAVQFVDEVSWVNYKLFISPLIGLTLISAAIYYSLNGNGKK